MNILGTENLPYTLVIKVSEMNKMKKVEVLKRFLESILNKENNIMRLRNQARIIESFFQTNKYQIAEF